MILLCMYLCSSIKKHNSGTPVEISTKLGRHTCDLQSEKNTVGLSHHYMHRGGVKRGDM